MFGTAVLVVTLQLRAAEPQLLLEGRLDRAVELEGVPLGVLDRPARHPDFAWAFAARFLFILGYFVVVAFQLYILTDYLRPAVAEANATIVPLSLAGMVTTLVAIAVAGLGGATGSAAARSSSTPPPRSW